MGHYTIDSTGLELIRSFEGYVDGVYNDSRGFATGGVGHLFHTSPATVQDHRTYDHKGWAFWEHLLHQDVQRVSLDAMDRYLRVPLNINQRRAVASATFNCGGGFVADTVGRLINERKWQAAADAFMLWTHPPELRARREQERALFLRPVRGAGNPEHLPWLSGAERKAVLEYDRLKHADHDLARRRVLRAEMHRMAVNVRFAAQHHGGWEVNHRRQRYHSLAARS